MNTHDHDWTRGMTAIEISKAIDEYPEGCGGKMEAVAQLGALLRIANAMESVAVSLDPSRRAKREQAEKQKKETNERAARWDVVDLNLGATDKRIKDSLLSCGINKQDVSRLNIPRWVNAASEAICERLFGTDLWRATEAEQAAVCREMETLNANDLRTLVTGTKTVERWNAAMAALAAKAEGGAE